MNEPDDRIELEVIEKKLRDELKIVVGKINDKVLGYNDHTFTYEEGLTEEEKFWQKYNISPEQIFEKSANE